MTHRWARLVGALAVLGLLGALWFTWTPRVPDFAAGAPTEPSATGASTAPLVVPPAADEAPGLSEERVSTAVQPGESAAGVAGRELRAVLLDKADSSPLFDFELAVSTTGGRDPAPLRVRTDERGECLLARLERGARLPPQVWLHLIDHPSIRYHSSDRSHWRLELGGASLAEPLRVEVEVGPTVAFDVELPAGTRPGDFTVGHYSSRPAPGRLARCGEVVELRPPFDRGPHPGRPWTRFGYPLSTSDLVWVELRSNDRRWQGGAWLPQLGGVVAEPLRIRLASTTHLTGRFLWPDDVDRPYVQGLRLAVVLDGRVHGRVEHGGAGADGAFEFEFLHPGRYRLWTIDAAWAPFELEFELGLGVNDIGAHALVPRRVAGPVSGVIRSRSGRYEGACHVSLANRRGFHDAAFDQSIDFEPVDEDDETSELVARFEFDDVTEGDWFLSVHCHDGFEFPGSMTVVRAPDEHVELVLDDPAIRVRLEFVEAESGAACSGARLSWSCGDAHDVVDGAQATIAPLPDAPELFTWVAWAPGRRVALGTGLGLERRALAGGEVELFARVPLELGFARRVRVSDRTLRTPLAGVEVLCDGEWAGETGSDGTVVISRSAPPQRITLRKAGWMQARTNDLDPASGRYSSDGELWAFFEPVGP